MKNPDTPRVVGGLVVYENGVDLPPVVIAHIAHGHAVIPVDREKVPLVEWKEYQNRQPTHEEIIEWIRAFGSRIWGWVRVTGARAGVIVVDLDAEAAVLAAEWGIAPHVKTGGGGYHLIFTHPGWPVKTVNSKSGKRHGEYYPNVDIRGDGGYSLIQGGDDGLRYEWLRSSDPDPLDVLPEPMRRFFGLWEAPTEPEARPEVERMRLERPGECVGDADVPTVEYLVERALGESALSGRNNGGYWLAQQLWDNGYEEPAILSAGEQYVAACPPVNTKGEPEPYTTEHYRKSMRQAMSLERREPWREEVIIAHFGHPLPAPEVPEPGETFDFDWTIYRSEIDKLLVPTDQGARGEYPPWAISDFLRRGHRGIVYGMAGCAKSYCMVDLTRAAITGGFWLGSRVMAGSVIYIAGEDPLGIHHRVETTVRHFGIPRRHEARVLEQPLALTNPKEVEQLLALFDYLPEKPAYVIVDNLSLCMGDDDSIEGAAAKKFLDGCNALQTYKWRAQDPSPTVRATDLLDITVIVVHHTNKSNQFNGSMFFRNFVDAMSELVWDEKSNQGSLRTLYSVKQRHGDLHKPWPFELLEVDPQRKICVVVPKVMPPAATEAEVTRRKLVPQELAILDCLHWGHQEWLLARAQDMFAPEGLQRGQITFRSGVPGGSMSKFLSKVIGAGLVEVVPVQVERGEPKPPNRYRLTREGQTVAQEATTTLDKFIGEGQGQGGKS